MIFGGALWESRSHGKNKAVLALLILMLVAFIGIPFSIHFFGVGVVFGVDVIVALALLVAVIIVGRIQKWQNPRNVFALCADGLYFTQAAKNQTQINSYFYNEYENISGYDFVTDPDGLTTATIYFKTPSSAGILGRLKSITLVRVENFAAAKQILEDHGVPQLQRENRN